MEAHSYSGGTEAWYLARAARSRGYEVSFDFRTEFAGDVDFPAVVGVRLGGIGHFIPILECDGDGFLIGDPLHGREFLPKDELLRRYAFTGFNMLISRKNEAGDDPGS